MDTSIVGSTEEIVEWKNASHQGVLENIFCKAELGRINRLSSRTSEHKHCQVDKVNC